MTKKKALIYSIIFVILVSITAIWKSFYFKDLTKDFPDVCKMVIAPSCQYYIMNISEQKKYEEAVKIQKVRVIENEKILKFYRSKIFNKCLLSMTPKEADESILKCAGLPDTAANADRKKTDYFIIKAADFTIQDIVTDSLAIAEIQLNEFKDPDAAVKTLKNAQKVLNKNPYFSASQEAQKVVQTQLSQIKHQKEGFPKK